jgi:hypothetical protein
MCGNSLAPDFAHLALNPRLVKGGRACGGLSHRRDGEEGDGISRETVYSYLRAEPASAPLTR